MGQEISSTSYSQQDFDRFRDNLQKETQLFSERFTQDGLCHKQGTAGFEIEAWLINGETLPAPVNEEFLERLQHPLVCPELSRFNIEINSTPEQLTSGALNRIRNELDTTLAACRQAAASLDVDIMMIGILPTVRAKDLNIDNMSNMNRYHALNREVLRLRDGRPLYVNIEGPVPLAMAHYDVMLEAATTSFQLHLQLHPARSKRYFNAAMIASAPVVAACANSPYLFGYELWDETRIPLFEQSVEVGSKDSRRVTFGNDYIRESVLELLEENITDYPVLIPNNQEHPPEEFSHLRFHNGTIWRWNRPLIGIEEDGTPHLRIEHRVIPAGPTVIDSIANAALFYGTCDWLANMKHAPESLLDFDDARENFYRCARHGLSADITWLDNSNRSVRDVLLQNVIPGAGNALVRMGLDNTAVSDCMDILQQRVNSGQNGTCWQRNYVKHRAADVQRMCQAYLENQLANRPVHEWGF